MHTEQTRQSWIMEETANRKARIDREEWGIGFVIRGVPDVSEVTACKGHSGGQETLYLPLRGLKTPDPAAVKLLNILVKFLASDTCADPTPTRFPFFSLPCCLQDPLW